jgi:hypothetical protein
MIIINMKLYEWIIMDYGGLMTIHDHTEPILVLHSVAWTLGDIATKDKRPVGLGGVHSSIRFFPPKISGVV